MSKRFTIANFLSRVSRPSTRYLRKEEESLQLKYTTIKVLHLLYVLKESNNISDDFLMEDFDDVVKTLNQATDLIKKLTAELEKR
jgi:hypothetical protein